MGFLDIIDGGNLSRTFCIGFCLLPGGGESHVFHSFVNIGHEAYTFTESVSYIFVIDLFAFTKKIPTEFVSYLDNTLTWFVAAMLI